MNTYKKTAANIVFAKGGVEGNLREIQNIPTKIFSQSSRFFVILKNELHHPTKHPHPKS